VQFSEHTLTSDFSENSYSWQQQRNHFVTSFSVSNQEVFTPLNNTDVCFTVFKEREKHIQRQTTHTRISYSLPEMLCTLTFHLLICGNSSDPSLFTVLQGKQTAHWRREVRGSGHPTTWWWRDEVLCTISASLKQLLVSPWLKSSTVSDDLSNTDILEYNYKCSGNKLQMSLDHW